MGQLLAIAIISFSAGIPMVFGGLLAQLLHFKNQKAEETFIHWMQALGGGVLFAAVAFALIPLALHALPLSIIIVIFLLGTLTFLILDIIVTNSGIQFSQLISMLLDYLPEALVLGASFAVNPAFGALLAVFIGLQNFPEGFNAYKELRNHYKPLQSQTILLILTLLGVCFATIGSIHLTGKESLIAGILLFASGGIIYLLFEDIAPQSKKQGTWIPASGASIGFLTGMIAEKII